MRRSRITAAHRIAKPDYISCTNTNSQFCFALPKLRKWNDCSSLKLMTRRHAGLILILKTSTHKWLKRQLSIAEEIEPYLAVATIATAFLFLSIPRICRARLHCFTERATKNCAAEMWKSGHPELNRGPKRLARRFSPKGYLEPKWLRWLGIPIDRVRQSYMLMLGRKKITSRSKSRTKKKAPPQQKLRRRLKYRFRKGEQIVGTQEKSQQIVAQRLLSCLQYLDATKSSAKDLSLSPSNLLWVGIYFCR